MKVLEDNMKIQIINLEDTYRLYIDDCLYVEENNLSIILERLFILLFENTGITFSMETLDDSENWPNE